ncbi:NADP-dependent oxidoreductase [Streptomyces avermitilis]|uniref:NADP-dependent oxidoreductase n=1 Tax=Streptomyces avermitilis TaxID=33903 RepID=A0A4D4M971_STRAX|nr:NADP-dependent oxidoreductase [Streptomyces avermitilis]OOV21281.1 NADP-dependent oxidoreductase [Streptomyces avermitilis]GDY68189.1 NADP-dependent oxidoreductase [Streptomyces avermitilis]
MTAPLPRTAHEVRLTAIPEGLPTREHFTVVKTPLPEPGAGQVLVRNRHFLVFPGLRTLIGGEVNGLPLPPLRSGDTLFGPAVGEVVAAPADSPLRTGDAVVHMLGWREYALVTATECTPVDGTLPDPVAHLSPGSAAYGALTRLADVRSGDIVFVTGAAGAVGSLAGQIARLLGARRVIGSTGSPDKAERLVSELGYDAVVLRGAGPLAAQLAKAAPEGIDVLVDTVAGEQLVAALGAARQGARFALVGALSGQMAARGTGSSAPVEIDAFRLLIKGVSLRGYSGADHPDVEKEWTSRFGDWLRSGKISFPHARIAGIDRAPQALQEMIEGKHFGAVVVEL